VTKFLARPGKEPRSTGFCKLIIIIILCSIDSSDVNAGSTSVSEFRHGSLGSLQITITLTECALLIFLQSEVEKLLAWPAGDWTHNLRSLFSVRCLLPLSHGDPCCHKDYSHRVLFKKTINVSQMMTTLLSQWSSWLLGNHNQL